MAGRIFVDADACPVREETVRVAARHRMGVVLVSDGGIRPHPAPHVEVVIVAQGADAADMWIAERAGPGDICVTSDLPLAARALAAGAAAIRPDGKVLTADGIGHRLAMRDLMADLRAASPLETMVGGGRGGPRPFSKSDRSRFLDRLETLARKAGGRLRSAPGG
ncbi:MAG: YaiI/YqxD family protein [Paracoccaceae bacterium]